MKMHAVITLLADIVGRSYGGLVSLTQSERDVIATLADWIEETTGLDAELPAAEDSEA